MSWERKKRLEHCYIQLQGQKILNYFNIFTSISNAAKYIWLPVEPSTQYEIYQWTTLQRLDVSAVLFFSFIGTMTG